MDHILTGLVWLFVPAVFLLAVASELGARWWIHHRSRYYVFPPGLRLRLRPDPEISSHLESLVRFDVNRQGERGNDVPRSVDGLYRVLVVGGSQPEGYLLDQDTSWPGALQRLLETPDHKERLGASNVHVGNIARSGVGSESLDLILERVLPNYTRLHMIIILVGASDVLRWLEAGAPPSPPRPAPASEVFRCHPELTFGWKLKQLALVELFLRIRHRWLRPVQLHESACKWIRKARAMRARATQIQTTLPDPTPMLAHLDLHFRHALQKALAHADRVLVVRQPWFDKHATPEEMAYMWHGGIGQAWSEEVTTFYSLEVLSKLMALLDAEVARVAQELDVEQVDLMPILERNLRTYYDFFHATPAGARRVARAVAAAVLRQPLPSTRARRLGPHAADTIDGADSGDLRQRVS